VFAVRRPADAPPRQTREPAEVAIPAAEPRSHQVLCPEVIGRDAELAALEAHLADAEAGRGRTVLVGGEAGLGKTALLRRFAERARERQARVLVGECSEIEARRPFGPVIDAFRAQGLGLPEELGQYAPGAQALAETERYRAHAGFSERLAAESAAAPVVLVIEDLHWGDEATYELVPYLARKLRDRRVLLVATYRTDELHRTHPLNHVLAELARGRLADEILLRRLTVDELGEMLKLALGLDRPATREFRDALYARTEGNPFFVEEILRALVGTGELAYREGSWRRTKSVAELAIPVSVRDAVQQRLLALPPRARTVMQVSAVIGQRFEFDLLRDVSELDEDAVFEVIRAAIDAQLLAEEPEAEQESYRFRHALSREAVLADMLARERRVLHKKVAERIERTHSDRSEELAYHFDEARDTRAHRYHVAAAEEAVASYAFARAVSHLERAIELAPDDERGLGHLYLRLSQAALVSGDLHRAERAAEQAAAALKGAGDPTGWADATIGIAWLRWNFGDSRRARDLVEEAIRTVEALGDSRVLARGLAELARLWSLGADDPDATIALAERAAAMARRLGERGLEAHALISIGTTMSSKAGGSDLIRRAVELTKDAGPVDTAARAYNNLSLALGREGAPLEEIDRVMDEASAHARRYGYRSDTLLAREAERAFTRLDWDQALAAAEEGDPSTVWGAMRALLRSLGLTFRLGPDPSVYAAAQDAARRLEAAGAPQFTIGALAIRVLYGLAGSHERAAALPGTISEVLGSAAPSLGRHVPHFAAATLHSAYLLRDDGLVRHWRDTWARALGERHVTALLGDALLARSDGRDDDALAALRAIEETPARRGFHLRSVAAQQKAELLAKRGDREGARAAADAAREPFRTAGATWYLGELDRWARELGLE